MNRKKKPYSQESVKKIKNEKREIIPDYLLKHIHDYQKTHGKNSNDLKKELSDREQSEKMRKQRQGLD